MNTTKAQAKQTANLAEVKYLAAYDAYYKAYFKSLKPGFSSPQIKKDLKALEAKKNKSFSESCLALRAFHLTK